MSTIDQELLNKVMSKVAFTPPPGNAPPGTSMMGGMPLGGMPMDPSMMSGMMPPMDPLIMGGSGDPEALQKTLENVDERLKNLEAKAKIIMDKLDLLISDVDYTKMGSENDGQRKSILYAIKQLITEE